MGPAVMLLLLPKCPACVAAYLAVFTGAGLAAPMAGYVRPLLLMTFAASMVLLLADWIAGRRGAVGWRRRPSDVYFTGVQIAAWYPIRPRLRRKLADTACLPSETDVLPGCTWRNGGGATTCGLP